MFVKLLYIFLFLSFNILNKRVVNVICSENIALTDCVLSTTDVTIMTSSSLKFHKILPMKFPTKCIIPIFRILKIDRITSFYYLFTIRPSTCSTLSCTCWILCITLLQPYFVFHSLGQRGQILALKGSWQRRGKAGVCIRCVGRIM